MLRKLVLIVYNFPFFILACSYHHFDRRNKVDSDILACTALEFFFFLNLASVLLGLDVVGVYDVPWHYFNWFGRNLFSYIVSVTFLFLIAYALSSIGSVKLALSKELEGVYLRLGLKGFHVLIYLGFSFVATFILIFLYRDSNWNLCRRGPRGQLHATRTPHRVSRCPLPGDQSRELPAGSVHQAQGRGELLTVACWNRREWTGSTGLRKD